jgi:hypothetical protein
MTDPRRCPTCDAELPPGTSVQGQCPRCLLRAGQTPTGYTTAAGASGPELSAEELQQAFPELEFGRLLGRGGMGTVYEARQIKLDRQVAVKILSRAASCPSGGSAFPRTRCRWTCGSTRS